METGTRMAIVSARTRVFEVVPQAEYIAPGERLTNLNTWLLLLKDTYLATTSLTQCFHRQGARMYTPPSSTSSARR
jgi:hypothetical protein